MRYFILSTLLLLVCLAKAQFPNILLDDKRDRFTPSEPSIAISLKNPKHIVAGAILDKVYYTKNGGKKWKQGKLESPFGVYGDPCIVSDSKGKFYYFHLSDPPAVAGEAEHLDRIVCQYSTSKGKKWSRGSGIGFNLPKDQDKEWVAINPENGHVYITWTQFDLYESKAENDHSNILFSKSIDGGDSWSNPLNINELKGDCLDDDGTVEGAVPAVGPNGEIYVAWSLNEKIWFDRSEDEGETWMKEDIKVADQPGGWTMDIPGIYRCNGMPITACDLSSGSHRGSIYVNWADKKNGEDDSDIWIAKSIDGGLHWSAPKRINDDAAGKQQFLPWMAIDQTSGYIYVVYYDRRAHSDNATDVYLAWSEDGGETFKNVKISEESFTPNPAVFFGDYNNIAAHKGVIAPIWTRMTDMKTSVWTSVIKNEELRIKNEE